MVDQAAREIFQARITGFGGFVPAAVANNIGLDNAFARFVEQAARGAKGNDLDAAERLAAALARVAFVTPEATTLIYDAFARGWLGAAASGLATPPELRCGGSPAARTAGAAGLFLDSVLERSRGCCHRLVGRRHHQPGRCPAGPGTAGIRGPSRDRQRASIRAPPMPPTGRCRRICGWRRWRPSPSGSLGHEFYRLIIDNGFDLEVLDREAIGLSKLPPALAYLNTRILQMHDIWHLVGDYRTTALHEVAISSFQLAQFNHSYSAMFLAVVVASGRFVFPPGLPVLLQVMAEAWFHGRTSPAFMAIPWEAEWHQPLAEIRAKHGIEPFRSLIPADLVEKSRGQAAA